MLHNTGGILTTVGGLVGHVTYTTMCLSQRELMKVADQYFKVLLAVHEISNAALSCGPSGLVVRASH